MSAYSIAVDIGGTFTDIVLRHDDGRFWVEKTLTTADDLSRGFFDGVQSVLRTANCTPAEVDHVLVHATTIVTNAIIERKGPKTALLVTEGFRDVLVIRDECRSDIFDNQLEVPDALIPPELTFPVPERMTADGTVLKKVDQKAVEAIARNLIKAGVRSVAVCLLNSYRNPTNEQAVCDVLQKVNPNCFVSLSAEVAPQMREYPRASTVALNAYTMPIVQPYLDGLRNGLRKAGFRQDLLIMLSSGGVIGAELAARHPVRMIESGPAAGALAASYYAKLLDLDHLLSFDMGGTTAKACFIQGKQPLVTGAFEVDRIYRFQQGSGLPVTIPCIDLIEIGAGGGSIAAVDGLGLMTVGPRSAGSEPGPACYGSGGMEPTVTDADLILGMLDASNFLGGEMPLDGGKARQALAALGSKLALGIEETASGIYKMVGESMASAVRAHATDRGVDWRGIPLLAFGGAGPVHACYVADLLESTMVLYPPMASVLSAFGTLVTPVRLDLVRSDLGLVGRLDWPVIAQRLAGLATDAEAALLKAGCAKRDLRIAIAADCRYHGQHNELTVSLPSGAVEVRSDEELRNLFESAYEQKYGIRLADVDVEIVAWRVSAFGPEVDQAPIRLPERPDSTLPKSRQVLFPTGWHETFVLARAHLDQGTEIEGPAIIEERETTIVILPGWRASVDRHGCISATKKEQGLGQHSLTSALE